jgi:hypothetical protein
VGPLFIELYESERTSAVYWLDRSAEKWLGWPISHYDARTDLDARLNAELENAGFVDKLMNVAIEFTEQFQADSDCFEDAALDRTSAALRREMLDHIESVARFWMATASFANEQWQAELLKMADATPRTSLAQWLGFFRDRDPDFSHHLMVAVSSFVTGLHWGELLSLKGGIYSFAMELDAAYYLRRVYAIYGEPPHSLLNSAIAELLSTKAASPE